MKAAKPPQQQVREDLASIVATQINSVWQRPIAEHSAVAFASVRERVEASGQPLILDSCCGTGDSTRWLAKTFPETLVLGIDKSAHRLARHQQSDDGNYLIVRADVNDFWRLAVTAGWRLARHYLFYPNPYPKASQVRKRWYASPAFPSLLQLGGVLTVRSNWALYTQEFLLALNTQGRNGSLSQIAVNEPVSAFEAKYNERGQALFQVVANLEPNAP
ncbi:MAG: tRNA (guanine(46)-N(7))-methyltransferase TrmB [Pseudomonadales bacterium]